MLYEVITTGNGSRVPVALQECAFTLAAPAVNAPLGDLALEGFAFGFDVRLSHLSEVSSAG